MEKKGVLECKYRLFLCRESSKKLTHTYKKSTVAQGSNYTKTMEAIALVPFDLALLPLNFRAFFSM